MIGNLAYMAIAVPDLELAIQCYQKLLGVFVTSPQKATNEGIRFATVKLPNTLIKLMAPLAENFSFKDFFTKNPQGGVHHLCYEVSNLEEVKALLCSSGTQTVKNPYLFLDNSPSFIFDSQSPFGVMIAIRERTMPSLKERVEIDSMKAVHTPHLSSDSFKGAGGIGINIEVDFHKKTPPDNRESE